jgi:hypothetical protein|tara:strand:+ start:172 stop:684 length:513 start_codon:yes stop_codon:yes gene_type:complete
MRVYIESNDKETALKYYWGVIACTHGRSGDDDNDNDPMEFDSIEDHMDWYVSLPDSCVHPGYVETVLLNGWDESAGKSSELEITYFKKYSDLVNDNDAEEARLWYDAGCPKKSEYKQLLIKKVVDGKTLHKIINDKSRAERDECGLESHFGPEGAVRTNVEAVGLEWESE